MLPPSGQSNEVTHAYFRWLWEQYLHGIPVPRVAVDSTNPMFIYSAGFAMVCFFVLFTLFFTSTHRKKGEIYGVTSYAGNLLERMGRVSWFSVGVFVFVFLWALYFPVVQILFGQVY